MKKFLVIGCVVLVIVMIVSSFLGYKFYKHVQSIRGKYEEVNNGFAALNKQFDFQVPPDGLIQKDRFEKWLSIRGKMAVIMPDYQKMAVELHVGNMNAMQRYSADALMDLQKLLREESMSAYEYAWIFRYVISAFGSGDIRLNPDFRDVIDAFDNLNKGGIDFKFDVKPIVVVPVTSRQVAVIAGLVKDNRSAVMETMKVCNLDLIMFLFRCMPDSEKNAGTGKTGPE